MFHLTEGTLKLEYRNPKTQTILYQKTLACYQRKRLPVREGDNFHAFLAWNSDRLGQISIPLHGNPIALFLLDAAVHLPDIFSLGSPQLRTGLGILFSFKVSFEKHYNLDICFVSTWSRHLFLTTLSKAESRLSINF